MPGGMSEALRSRTLWIVVALVIADLAAAVETAMIFLALPSILQEYARPTAVGWLLTGYLLMSAVSAAICGRLGDLFGRRTVLLVVLAVAGLGSVISALAPTLEGVIFGRVIQGVTGAVLPLCFGIAREHVPPSHLSMSITIIAAGSTLGAALGIIGAGMIMDMWGWRYVFFGSATLLFLSIGAMMIVPPSRGAHDGRPLDLMGGILFAPAVAGALLAISSGRDWGWDGRVWGLLAGSIVLFGVWIRHELRCSYPLLDVRVLANRRIAMTNLLLLLLGLAGLPLTQLVLLLLQQPKWTGIGLGLTATAAAIIKTPSSLIASAGGPLIGYLCKRWGPSAVIMLASTLVFLALSSLFLFYDNLWVVFAVSVIGATGVISTLMSTSVVLVSAAPGSRTSEIMGIATVTRLVAFAIGTQSMAMVLTSSTVSHPSHPGLYGDLAAYQTQFAIMALGFVGIFVLAFFSREGPVGAERMDGQQDAEVRPQSGGTGFTVATSAPLQTGAMTEKRAHP